MVSPNQSGAVLAHTAQEIDGLPYKYAKIDQPDFDRLYQVQSSNQIINRKQSNKHYLVRKNRTIVKNQN
jgi:hypothetical protein